MKNIIFLTIIVGLFLSGCATTHEGNIAGKVGALIGAGAGAVIAHNTDGSAGEGAAVGAGVGMTAGQVYGDYFGGKHEKLEREALARQSVVTMYNNASDAYTSCVNNAYVQRRDPSLCRQILYAAGLEQPPTTGNRKTDYLFGFRR